MRVLHVTESFGGGVAAALCCYAENTSEIDHILVAQIKRESMSESDFRENIFSAVEELGGNIIQRMFKIRKLVQKYSPDIIHAHSSIGGALVRVALAGRRNIPIVYTPHCYSFERMDINILKKNVYWAIEKVLSHRTDAVFACSPREADLAISLNRNYLVQIIPNVPALGFESNLFEMGNKIFSKKSPSGVRIVGMGRLGAQKDPEFFLRVVKMIRTQINADFVWIGGGDVQLQAVLEAEDIHVSGWLSSAETSSLLSTADIYIHTASWEGMPVALLEAASIGVPTIVRSVKSMPWVTAAIGGDSENQIASLAVEILSRDDSKERNLRFWTDLASQHTHQIQSHALYSAYNSLYSNV